jgi:hypothetical protein
MFSEFFTKEVVMRALLAACLLLVVAVPSFGLLSREWRFIERDGTVWLQRGVAVFDEFQKGDNPPVASMCQDVPRLDYSLASDIPLKEDESVLNKLYTRIGRWSVRTLHIWGYDNIETDDCKFILGWGTAFVIGLYGDKLIWATVEHNVDTRKYWDKTVATQWFIRDDEGGWRELFLVGCSKDRFCILLSNNLPLLPINLFDDDYITNDIKVLDKTYVYGCSLVPERIKYLVHYKLHFFCLGNEGYVNSPHSIKYRGGGDFLVSNSAMPGFSGSPVLMYQDRWLLLGVVNAGVEGVFTAVHFLDPKILQKVKDWLAKNPMR